MSALVKPPAALKKRALTAKQQQQHNNSVGFLGEARAVDLLQNKGYQILEQNTSFKVFEVDIIAFDPTHQELVFCEVKTRTASNFGHPSQAINWKKHRSLLKVADKYCQHHPEFQDFRFDVITVSPERIEHFINITG